MEVVIHEVGLRDGLQIEKQIVPTEKKLAWIEALVDSGVDIIQLGSFVNPARVPQMADTDQLFRHCAQTRTRTTNPVFSALVLNEIGLERGEACGVDMYCMGVSASDTHSRKNTGRGTEEALVEIIGMARKAISLGRRVQASVQSAFGCGFEGPIPEERVLTIVRRYLEAGIRNISLADTAGHANPLQVERLFSQIRRLDSAADLAGHFHNTYGLGLANVFTALRQGVKTMESALGGLGGCPFTKVAAGNVCTEDLIHSLQRMDVRRDVKLDRLVAVAGDVGRFFERELPGFVLRAGSLLSSDHKDTRCCQT
jgi:hydroxymethylglutaryl-CoA lyase